MSSSRSSLLVTAVAPADLTKRDLADWRALFDRQGARANPFLHPVWVEEWFAAFVEPGQARVLLVRRKSTGELIGLAPVYEQAVRTAGLRWATRTVLAGAGTVPNAFELPGVLVSSEHTRDVLRFLVGELLDDRPDSWTEVTLQSDQGWFEPEWIFTKAKAPVAFGDHQRSMACVVLPLAETWEATRSSLKRNLKESVRRSYNRLAKAPGSWKVQHRRGSDLDAACLERFLDLHRERSSNGQASVTHPDAYADGRNRALVLAAVPRLAAEGLASVFELEIDGVVVAAQLALHAGSLSYVHSSGFDPDTWALGPITLLQTELVKYAVSAGHQYVNFSPGPSVSKLRWSEEIWVSNEFSFGAGGRRMGLAFSAFQALRSARRVNSSVSFMRRQSKHSSPVTVVSPAASSRQPGDRPAGSSTPDLRVTPGSSPDSDPNDALRRSSRAS